MTRVTTADPPAVWAEHVGTLAARRDRLDDRRFDTLRFPDERTDLTVGLAAGDRWIGGAVEAANDVRCVPNIPTEEIFTCPDRRRADGRVVFSRPVALGEATVSGLALEFTRGAVTRISAEGGREIVEALAASDQGAARLGEVGLVPRASPVARVGVLFHSALVDENAATHLALGRSYAASAPNGDESANELGVQWERDR